MSASWCQFVTGHGCSCLSTWPGPTRCVPGQRVTGSQHYTSEGRSAVPPCLEVPCPHLPPLLGDIPGRLGTAGPAPGQPLPQVPSWGQDRGSPGSRQHRRLFQPRPVRVRLCAACVSLGQWQAQGGVYGQGVGLSARGVDLSQLPREEGDAAQTAAADTETYLLHETSGGGWAELCPQVHMSEP